MSIGSSLLKVKFETRNGFKMNIMQEYILNHIKDGEINVIITPRQTGSSTLCNFLAGNDLLMENNKNIGCLSDKQDRASHISSKVNAQIGYVPNKHFIAKNGAKVTSFGTNKLTCSTNFDELQDIIYIDEYLTKFDPKVLDKASKVIIDLSTIGIDTPLYDFLLKHKDNINIIEPGWKDIFDSDSELLQYLIQHTKLLNYDIEVVSRELFLFNLHTYLEKQLSMEFINSIHYKTVCRYIDFLNISCSHNKDAEKLIEFLKWINS